MAPMVDGIFSLPPYDKAPPTLLGSSCPDCKLYYFPRTKYCPNCFAINSQTPLNSTGIIYTYTVVRIKPPFELPSPYSVVYVDLKKVNLRVFGLFDPDAIDNLHIGLDVELTVGPIGVDCKGKKCLRPYFKIRN